MSNEGRILLGQILVALSFLMLSNDAQAQPTIYIDLDLDTNGIQTERTVSAGTVFPIAVVVFDDSTEGSPTTFDRAVVEVYFNSKDDDPVLSTDPTRRPAAGELAAHSPTTVDAFSEERVKPGAPHRLLGLTADADSAFGDDLYRQPPTEEAKGPWLNSTGAAGLQDLENPFQISPGDAPQTLAAGKAAAGFSALREGTSKIMAAGSPFGAPALSLKGAAIETRFVPSVVHVTED